MNQFQTSGQSTSINLQILTILNHYIHQLSLGLLSRAVPRGPLVFRKPQTDTVDTMPLIGGSRKALALKDVAEVTSAVTADNLCALHAEGIIDVSLDSTGNRIEVSGPATARLELMIGRVQGRIATSAVVNTCGRVVGVVFTRSCALCALLSENAKLLCISK